MLIILCQFSSVASRDVRRSATVCDDMQQEKLTSLLVLAVAELRRRAIHVASPRCLETATRSDFCCTSSLSPCTSRDATKLNLDELDQFRSVLSRRAMCGVCNLQHCCDEVQQHESLLSSFNSTVESTHDPSFFAYVFTYAGLKQWQKLLQLIIYLILTSP